MEISPFDIAIILISAVACVYCMVLSRRLRALQNTRNGLGATIKALSDSISAVSATTDEARYHAGELAGRLAHLIEDAKSSCERVERLTEQMNQAQVIAQTQVQAQTQALLRAQVAPPPPVETYAPPRVEAASSVREKLDQNSEQLREISDLMHHLKNLSEDSVVAAQHDRVQASRPAQLRPRMKVV